MKKTLTHQEYMQGLALFTVAQKHYDKSREFEAALCELVGADEDMGVYAGCISDALYNEESFDQGLKREGIAVEPKAVPASDPSADEVTGAIGRNDDGKKG